MLFTVELAIDKKVFHSSALPNEKFLKILYYTDEQNVSNISHEMSLLSFIFERLRRKSHLDRLFKAVGKVFITLEYSLLLTLIPVCSICAQSFHFDKISRNTKHFRKI